MPIPRQRNYRFVPPVPHAAPNFTNFSELLNTRSSDLIVGSQALTRANNIRGTVDGGFQTRPGGTIQGNSVGATTNILGLHSYVKKDLTAYLLATQGTDIYNYSQAGTGAVIATSTAAQATGYSKDRNVFITTAHTDANGLPYSVVIYQSGAGLILEWEDTPYNTWTNATVSIDATTQIGFCGYMDSSDNIHLAYMSDANTVKYVKLSYAAGPTWTVGTKVTVTGSGVSDSASNPTIVAESATIIHVAYRYYNGTTYTIQEKISIDSGASFAGGTTTFTRYTDTEANKACALMLTGYVGSEVTMVVQYNGTSKYFDLWFYRSSDARWVGVSPIATGISALTTNAFSFAWPYGKAAGYIIKYETSSTSNGTSVTAFNTPDGPFRTFSVVNDGVNDNDIQYKNTIDGTEDSVATRITNNTSNNIYPAAASNLSASARFVPVIYMEGTVSPYNIRINVATQWVSLSASLTSGLPMESAYFPNTAAGGTDQIYLTNGTDTVKKWDGTTLTSASAVGYPKPKWIFSMDGRLWMGNYSTTQNRAAYTNLGSDNFTGTFPAGNTLDFPEYTVWGHLYRDSTAIIFGRSSLYLVQNFDYSGAAVGPEKVRKIPDSYGCISGRTVKQVGGWVYYMRPDGHLMRTNGQYAELVSDVISGTIASLAQPQLTNAAAGTLDYYYYVSVAGNGAAQNDTWLVLDTRKAPDFGWTVDTGKYTSCFVTHPDSNNNLQLYWGDARATTGIVYHGETGTSDNGTAIVVDVQTGLNAYGDLYLNKMVRNALVLAEASGDYEMLFGVATGEYTATFTDFSIDLNPEGAIWGSFIWGDFTWGARSNIERNIKINARDRLFRYRIYHAGLDEPIAVLGFATTFDIIKTVL